MSPSLWFRTAGLCCLVILAGAIASAWSDQAKGKRYALLVGVKSYDHRKLTDLKFTENDVEELSAVLETPCRSPPLDGWIAT